MKRDVVLVFFVVSSWVVVVYRVLDFAKRVCERQLSIAAALFKKEEEGWCVW